MSLHLTTTLHLTNPLTHSADVLAVQHLLTAKGFPVVCDSWFGPETAAACVQAKRRLKFPLADQVPSAGPRLVKALEAAKPFKPPPLPAARVRFVQQLEQAIDERARWRYRQSRPIPHPPVNGLIITDCSGGITFCAESAGVTDPNGRRYDGLGWTGTLMSNCEGITFDMLRPGDLVTFGVWPGHHVCGVLKIDDNPTLWSHGRAGDPRRIDLMAEQASQAARGHGQATFLRFLA